MGDLLDLGVANEIIVKSGTWFSYKENRIGQGRENSKRFLGENPEIANEIESQLRQKLGLAGVVEKLPDENSTVTEETPTKIKKAGKNG